MRSFHRRYAHILGLSGIGPRTCREAGWTTAGSIL
jgi:hypothetical protein